MLPHLILKSFLRYYYQNLLSTIKLLFKISKTILMKFYDILLLQLLLLFT